ncbi:hypothetical protein ABPG74_019873 [Tetrahymena malaccensis]
MDQISYQHDYEYFLIKNYKLCPIHNQRLTLLKVDSNQNNELLQCLGCHAEQHFKFIPLMAFLNSDFSTIIKGWPILEDSQLYQQLKGTAQKETLIQQDIQKVQNYYKSLRTVINSLIDEKEKKSLMNIQKRYDKFEYPIDLYNQFSNKEKLKDIILNQYQNQDKQNEQFSQIVKENLQNQENNKKKLLESLDNLNKNTLNLESHNQIKDKIIKLIESLNDFTSNEDIFNNSQQLIMNTQIQQGQNIRLVQNLEIKIDSLKDLDKIDDYSIVNINLNGNDIQVEGAKQIALALQKLENTTSLILRLQYLFYHSIFQFQSIQNQEIFYIYIKENNIQTEGAKEIALSLQKLQKITNLNLNLCKNNIKVEGAKQIALALKKCKNIKVLKLYLGESNIQDEGARQIASTLESLPDMTNLILGLNSNNIGTQGSNQIVAALQKCVKISNLALDLRQNNLSIEQQNTLRQLIQSSSTQAKVQIYT